MTRLLAFFILTLSLSSCYTTQYFVGTKYKLEKVNSTSERSSMGYSDNNMYIDEYISITPVVSNPLISLQVKNLHNSSIKILWNETSYVDYTGKAHRIVHKGINPTDKEISHIPTIIPAGSHIEDTVAPIDCITFDEEHWITTPVNDYENYKFNKREQAESLAEECQKNPNISQCQLLLTLEIDGEKVEYTLNFIGDKFYVDSEKVTDTSTTTTAIGMSILGVVLISLLFLL